MLPVLVWTQLLLTGRPRLERETVHFLALTGSNTTSTSGLWSLAAAAARVDWAVKAEAIVAPSVATGNFCLTAEQVQLLLKPHSETKATEQRQAVAV